MSEAIVNKVANSGLITLDLEDFLPREEVVVFDLKDHLFMGLILKEKDFREALKNLDLEQYRDRLVAITCTADAVIPYWAYMLIATSLHGVARGFYVGDEAATRRHFFLQNIAAINVAELADQRVVVKGCSDGPVGEYAYAEITRVLLPVVKSIMYGEPCSTVPVYKKK